MAKSLRRDSEAPRAALELLFEETVSLYHQLTASAVKIHGGGALSGPRRTVLVGLARSGRQTVAQMARGRAQSRQRFQPLVNGLIADGLVEAVPNPSHKSSPLIALTRRGERSVRTILERESSLRARFRIESSPAAVRRAAMVLREVRHALIAQLPELLAAIDRPSRK
jgi:DNA-binding MarR family transcriptional regulator